MGTSHGQESPVPQGFPLTLTVGGKPAKSGVCHLSRQHLVRGRTGIVRGGAGSSHGGRRPASSPRHRLEREVSPPAKPAGARYLLLSGTSPKVLTGEPG